MKVWTEKLLFTSFYDAHNVIMLFILIKQKYIPGKSNIVVYASWVGMLDLSSTMKCVHDKSNRPKNTAPPGNLKHKVKWDIQDSV